MTKKKVTTNPTPPPGRISSATSSSEDLLRQRVLNLKRQQSALDSAGRDSWSDERKITSVMFVDLVSSSRLVSGHDPEDANDSLLLILGLIVESIERYRGTIVQIMGDGILAVFGAPQSLEDHAIRACLTAKYIHERLQENLSRFEKFANLPVMVRIGIESGEVMIQSVVGQSQTDYRIIGDSVYSAQRLQSRAGPKTTFIGPEIVKILSTSITYKEKGLFQLVANQDPKPIYQLLEVNSIKRPSIYHNTFAGRKTELDHILRMIHQVESGGAGLGVCITGEAGIGKSRLIHEVKKRIPPQLQAIEYLLYNLPDQPQRFLQEVWRIFAPKQHNPQVQMKTLIEQQLLDLKIDEPFGPPALLDLLNMPVDDARWQSLGAEEKQSVAAATLAKIVLGSSQQTPIIFIIEDLQWPTSDITTFLENFIPYLADSRVFLLITKRANPKEPGVFNLPVISINCLTFPESRLITDWFLGPYPDLEELKERLHEKTQGNPLFLLESMQLFAQKGYIQGNIGNYRLIQSWFHFEVSATIQGILAERIDSLNINQREVLTTASVMGGEFFYTLLGRLLNSTTSAILPVLKELEELGFIVPEPATINKSPSSRFQHNLMQEVAYNGILKRNRRYLHQQSIIELEGDYGKKINQRRQQLAHHSSGALEWRKAYVYARYSAHGAFRRAANREAIDFYQLSLTALKKLQIDQENAKWGIRIIDVQLGLLKPCFTTGNWQRVHEILAKTLADSRKMQNPLKELETKTFYILLEWIKGNLEKAIDLGVELLKDPEKIMTDELRIRILSRIAAIYFDMGDLNKSLSLCSYIKTLFKIDLYKYNKFGLLVSCYVVLLTQLGQIYAEKGNFDLAIKYGREAVAIATSSPDILSQIYSMSWVGTIFMRQKNILEALSLLEKSAQLSLETRSKLLYHPSINGLAFCYIKNNRTDLANPYLEIGKDLFFAQSEDNYLSRYLNWLGEALFALGDVTLAKKVLDLVIPKSKKYNEMINWAWAQCTLVDITITNPKNLTKAKRLLQ